MTTHPAAIALSDSSGTGGDDGPGMMTEFFNNPFTEFLMWAGLVLAVLLAVGWFLSYTAVRLDRLHLRLKATAAALDAQLVRRAEATMHIALAGGLDPATAALLARAATQALESPTGSWAAERIESESELTDLLRLTGEILQAEHQANAELAEDLKLLHGAGIRVQLARRFHNEAVTDVVRLRQRPHTRIFRLAGHAPIPTAVEFDDAWPTRNNGSVSDVD